MVAEYGDTWLDQQGDRANENWHRVWQTVVIHVNYLCKWIIILCEFLLFKLQNFLFFFLDILQNSLKIAN